MLKVKTKSAHENRLLSNSHEREALRYLYETKVSSETFRNTIIDRILGQHSYEHFTWTDKEKEMNELCEKNPLLVEMIVDTLFQWFGTNVGSSMMSDFLISVKGKGQEENTTKHDVEYRLLKLKLDEEDELRIQKELREAETIRIETKGF